MRVLFVTGEDFSAVEFENENKGKSVTEIIDNISDYESDMWELSVYEFDSIDPKFIEFVRDNIQDYDQSKEQNFYVEGEKIRG